MDNGYEIRRMYESLSWYNEIATTFNFENGDYIMPVCEIHRSDGGLWILRRLEDDENSKMMRGEETALYMTTFVDGMSELVDYLHFGF